MKLLNLFKKNYSRLWDDISETPLYNWCMIHKHNNTKYMYDTNNYNKVKESKESVLAFEKIYEQYFDKYIINKDFRRWMDQKKLIAIKQAEAYTSGDMSLLTIAEIEEEKYKSFYEKKADVKVDLEKTITLLEKHLGFQINRKIMSVDSFFQHLTIFVEGNGEK